MKNYKQLFIVFAVSLFIVPQVVLAAWWNPLSWSIWNIFRSTSYVQVQVATTTSITPTTAVTKKADVNIKQNMVKETIIPKKDTVSPTSVKNTPIIKEDVKIANDPRTTLIAEFLKNPTLENFRTFCNSAKNIDGKKTKQILDSSRENMITVKLSLYDDFNDCQNLDNVDRGVSYLPLDNNLLVSLTSSDTDDMREAKIIFNEKVKNVMATSKLKFVAFKKYPITVQSPTELFQSYIDLYNKQVQYILNPPPGQVVESEEMRNADIRAQDNSLKFNLKYSADSIIDISSNFK